MRRDEADIFKVGRRLKNDSLMIFEYSLLTESAAEALATSFCKRAGFTALKAPAAAFVTALNIMVDRVKSRPVETPFPRSRQQSPLRVRH